MLEIPMGLANLSATGLLIILASLIIVSFFRGWVISKPYYQIIVKRADALQETVNTLIATNSVQARTIDKQTAVGETVVRVMSSVQDARTEKEG